MAPRSGLLCAIRQLPNQEMSRSGLISWAEFLVPVPKKGERFVVGLPRKDGVAWGKGNAEGGAVKQRVGLCSGCLPVELGATGTS
jgi:hypothetical protein